MQTKKLKGMGCSILVGVCVKYYVDSAFTKATVFPKLLPCPTAGVGSSGFSCVTCFVS